MRLTAHRGFAATNPENSIAAMRAAAPLADAVEFDVRRCGSGELVVIHDETIDRVTDGAGAVADLTLPELRSKRIDGSHERIPTLAAMLDALPPGVAVNCELKETGVAADVLTTLEDAAVPNHIVLTSFSTTELRSIHTLDPDQPTGLLAHRNLDRPVTTAVELGCEFLGVVYWRTLVSRLPERAHAVDVAIYVWGVPNALLARVLALRGVDGVSSDRPLSI